MKTPEIDPFEVEEFDPWDHIGTEIWATIFWMLIAIGLFVAACFINNMGLSVIFALIGMYILCDNVDMRMRRIINSYGEHLRIRRKS